MSIFRSQIPLLCNTKTVSTTANSYGPVVLLSAPIEYTFPLSFGYLCGYLKERGVDVRMIFNESWDFKALAQEIMDQKPVLAGFGSLYPNLELARRVIYYLNELGRDFPVCVGGHMVTPTPELAVTVTGAEYGVIGEGEIILYELYDAIRNNKPVQKVNGLCIRTDKGCQVTGKGSFINNLSELPEIPYELFPEEKWLYLGEWFASHLPEQAHWRMTDKVINIHGGRGCPFNCNFCYHHHKTRYRKIDDMMQEASRLLERFGANMLDFSDDLVISSPSRAKKLVAGITALHKKVAYSVSTRFDLLSRIDDDTLFAMKESGCRIMGLGIESGSDRMLKIIGKNTTADKILEGLERLKKVGILPTVSMMVGQFTETVDDVKQSLQLMRESVRSNPLINYAFTITTPFPGSQLYDFVMKNKLCSDDLDFYHKYFFGENKTGDFTQVANVSNMTDEEVRFWRNELEAQYDLEKSTAYSPVVSAELQQIFEQQKTYFQEYAALPFEQKEQQRADHVKKQIALETRKLQLWGIT